MAKKPSLTTITSGYTSTNVLNANFEALRQAFDNTVSRDGSVPNQLQADLDLDSNDIINVGTITDSTGDDVLQAAKDAATDAKAALDQFTDIYLGTYESAPTVDTDGDPLALGAIYYDTTVNALQVYNGDKFVVTYGTIPATGLPVSQGGTGATTAAQALINLGAGTTDEALALAIALG